MIGSKYSDAVRDKVKALAASGTMTGAQISKAVNVPKATVYEWIQKAREGDEDFQAELAQKRRKRLDRFGCAPLHFALALFLPPLGSSLLWLSPSLPSPVPSPLFFHPSIFCQAAYERHP